MLHPLRVLRGAVAVALVAMVLSGYSAAQSLWHVDADAAPGGDGTSWATAFDALEDAFDAAAHDDQVWVAQGVYRPTPGAGALDPRTAVFDLPDFVAVYGGFAGHELTLGERAGLFETTVLSGDLGLVGDPSDNAYRVVRFSSDFEQHADARLDGFRIEGARGEVGYRGGGLYLTANQGPNSWAVLDLANCSLVDNVSERGGGMAVDNFSRVRVLRCRFEGNRATLHGGGVWSLGGWVWSYDTLWADNHADHDGGATWANSSAAQSMHFVNDVFHDNSARRGGASFLASTPPISSGVGIYDHCTMAYGAALSGGAIHVEPGAKLRLRNSILWGNRALQHAQVFPHVASGNVVVEFCDVQGGFPGAGNLDLDPLFVDGPARDLRTGPGSPAHDAAAVEHIPLDHLDVDGDGVTAEPLPLDHADGRRRVDDPRVPDAQGAAPAPDMGAYEYLPD